MAKLDLIKDCGNDDLPRTNLIVVPGIAGASLQDRTCPHFRDWLDHLVVRCKSCAQSWVYNHHLEIDKLESWDTYSSTGHDLLLQLISKQRDEMFGKDGTLVLIGHKMGCYILKKALAEAYEKDLVEQRELLDKIDTIVMVGEPNLQAENQWEWFDLICVSIERPLPRKLASDLSVGVLQRISDEFEAVMLWSSLFEVSGVPRSKRKHRWKFKRTEPGGCICSVTIHVRNNTTADEAKLLEEGQGNDNLCPFDPGSTHFQNLLMVNSNSGQAQISNGQTHSSTIVDSVINNSLDFDQALIKDQLGIDTRHDQRASLDLGESSTPARTVPDGNEVADHISYQSDSFSTEYIEEVPPNISTNDIISPLPRTTDVSLHDVDTYRAGISEDAQPAQTMQTQRKRKPTFTSSIPPRDKYFFGRQSILSLLNNALLGIFHTSEVDRIQQEQPRIVYLTGSGGIGKTAIVVEHFYRSIDRIDAVLWLNANSQASLGKCCHDLAVALGLVNGRVCQDHEASRIKFLKWLETSRKIFLLILDDVVQDVDLTPYIPRCGNGSILITSRHKPYSSMDDGSVRIEVPAFSETEAVTFMYRVLFQGNQPDQARDLCVAATRYHASTLMLRHLVNWSIRHRISINYINKFLDARDLSLKLQVRLHGDPVDDILSKKLDTLDTTEFQVFNVLCLLDPEGVQNRLLLGAQRSQSLPLRFFPRDSDTLSNIIQQLWSSSLIEVDEIDASCSMHRAVQDAAKASMDNETFNQCFDTAGILVHAQWPPKRKFRNIINGFWPEFDSLHSQVHSLANSLIETDHIILDPDDDFKQLLINHTWYNSCRGNQIEDLDLLHLAYMLYSTPNDRKNHQVSSSPLPRRCLYVGSVSTPVTRLVDTNRQHGSYVALSYIWESQDMSHSSSKLTKNNVDHYQHGIKFNDLPLVIRDAITITRNLGLSYIWVDWLCIVQDSPEDLAEELTHMHEYFANCAAIIADRRRITSQRQLTRHKDDIVGVAQYCMYRKPQNFSNNLKYSVRGWAFQEMVLAPTPLVLNHKKFNIFMNEDDGKSAHESVTPDFPFAELGISASKFIENTTSGTEDLSQTTSNILASSIAEAQHALDKGQELMLHGSYVEATATLMLSKDLLGSLQAKHQDALDLYAVATSLLGTAYHVLNLNGVALDMLQAGIQIYMRLSSGKRTQDHAIGRMLLSIGTCLFGLGKIDESREKLEAAREQLRESDGGCTEWSASINIKLADCNIEMGKFGEAHVLLQSAMDYFQVQISDSSQRQLARILNRQSLVYEAEGNRIMRSAFSAAAYDAFAQIMKGHDYEGVASTDPLNQQAFDELVDPWHR